MKTRKGAAPSPPCPAGPAPARHGRAAGVQFSPERGDWTVPQHWERYTVAEHAVWRQLYERQVGLLQRWACEEFLQGLGMLDLAPAQIPDFGRLSEVLMRQTGWQVVAVPGLLPDEVFFEHLAHRRFPAGQFIRSAESLDYLEEPDVFHDIFGHVPMLMNPVMADFIQAYGQGGLRAQKLGTLSMLARVYWYTVEFGLVQQSDDLKLLGAGIVSSATESRFSLLDASPHRVHFSLDRVMRTPLPHRRLPGGLFRAAQPGRAAAPRSAGFRAGVRARVSTGRACPR